MKFAIGWNPFFLWKLLQIQFVLFMLCAVCFKFSMGNSEEKNVTNCSLNLTWTTEERDTRRVAEARLKQSLINSPVVAMKAAPHAVNGSDNLLICVDVGVIIAAVLNIDDVQQTMTSSTYMSVSWVDPSLSWNTSEHEGVERLIMPVEAVWTPLIYIVNSIDKQSIFSYTDVVNVNSNGMVNSLFDRIVVTYCDMDLQRYPYDTQLCPLIFNELIFPYILNMSLNFVEGLPLSSLFSYSSSWDLTDQRIDTIDMFGSSILSLSCEVQRKTMFYSVCLVVPLVMTSIMNTLVFLVPLQSGEKVSFLVSIFVSTSVFTSFFTNVMPRGLDSMPKTMKLLLGVIVESLLILLATLLVMARDDTVRASGGGVCPEVSARSDKQGRASEESSVSEKTSSVSVCLFGRKRANKTIPTINEDIHEKASTNTVDRISTFSGDTPSFPGLTTRRPKLEVTAKRLDRLFFVLTFFGNLVFLCVLFFE